MVWGKPSYSKNELGSKNVITSIEVGDAVPVVLPNSSDPATSFVGGIDAKASGDVLVAHVACNGNDPTELDNGFAAAEEIVNDQSLVVLDIKGAGISAIAVASPQMMVGDSFARCDNDVGSVVLDAIDSETVVNDVVVASEAELGADLGNVALQAIVNSNDIEFPSLQVSVQKKKGRGRGKDSRLIAGSSHKVGELNGRGYEEHARKPRAAAQGVANLLQEMKLKKKDHLEKVKQFKEVTVGALVCSSPSS
ncbi:hypothetical protein V6N11_036332 [Hibiscus sabdariffa]|uniref:Uncharacterized protein n=1 Tax=Hibiscus sabdariffa TaxID=183260 RepID=A0ABR2RA36_9ROSI